MNSSLLGRLDAAFDANATRFELRFACASAPVEQALTGTCMSAPRNLLVARHATALPQHASGRDFDRELSGDGRKEAARGARWLAATCPQLPRILASPARRTRETVEGLLGEAVNPSVTEWDTALYLADLPALLELIEVEEGDLMLVGHNPGLEDLLAFLLPVPETGGSLSVPPGAIFWLELPAAPLRRGAARLKARYLPTDSPPA